MPYKLTAKTDEDYEEMKTLLREAQVTPHAEDPTTRTVIVGGMDLDLVAELFDAGIRADAISYPA